MCNTCCKQCHGWCRAFTATELLLSILEAVLLIVFIVLLTFLILHLIVCPDNEKELSQIFIEPEENISFSDPEQSTEAMQTRTTLSPNMQCTWTPSHKTKASTQYFEFNVKLARVTNVSTKLQVPITEKILPSSSDDDEIHPYQTDDETANDKEVYVLSLVKMTPNDVIYGCILTIISEFWTVTAASCIESIEEENSLDSFVMINNVKDSTHGRTHVVSEVVVHPKYNSINKTYDITALKSADRISTGRNILNLPTMMDYFLLTIGERLLIIGFSRFRSRTNIEPSVRSVIEAAVHVLPASRCRPNSRERGAALCAGALSGRAACSLCAGTPLLQGATLLGIMQHDELCGETCEPALYVSLAAVSDWLKAVMNDD